jgi:hypothetical protein
VSLFAVCANTWLDACPTYVAAAIDHTVSTAAGSPPAPCSEQKSPPRQLAATEESPFPTLIPPVQILQPFPLCPSIHSILSHGKTLQGNCRTNISTFYSNFPIVKYWDLICISPLSNKPFHEIIFQGKFKFFLVVPQGNFLKKFVVNCPTYVSCALLPSLSSLGSIRRRRRRVRTATGIYMHPLLHLILRDLITLYI